MKKEEPKKAATLPKAQQETKAIVTRDDNRQVAVATRHQEMLDEDDIQATDLLLGKMLSMQGLSKLVSEGKATIGEIRDSVTGKLLCKKGESLEVILFKPFKTWVQFIKNGGKEQFDSVVPFGTDNADWEREYVDEHKRIFVRYQCLNYFSLLTQEIKDGDYRPRVLSLRSTAYKTGRKIETTRAFLKKMGLSLPFKTLNLCTTQQKNDKGTWFIPDVTEGRKSTEQELDAVKEWMSLIGASSVKIDHSDLAQEPEGMAEGEIKKDSKF